MAEQTSSRARRRCAALLVPLALLAGCADMAARTPPDSPLSQVVAEYGQPNFSCPLANGGRRVIWTQQPLGQFAWGGNVGPDGRIDRVERILTDQHFSLLSEGDWPANRVLCEFGPPAIVDEVGLPSVRQVVWSYRYRENDSWNSLMYVYMGRKGDRVTRHHPGPDPMYEQPLDFSR
ncbi:hypothetical protein AKI39_18465 [Bordetella sp. H567]|uniref:hypothetical protein n=1 Tax=Bordetella sp. H567 TaxID=1697043 RepID=UPI00081CAB87|nr:hypothetical protein [Bordetella sp. H567]AOB32278.1 hypothetical protein AKI39_18465 [Bordetella sp. H567]